MDEKVILLLTQLLKELKAQNRLLQDIEKNTRNQQV